MRDLFPTMSFDDMARGRQQVAPEVPQQTRDPGDIAAENRAEFLRILRGAVDPTQSRALWGFGRQVVEEAQRRPLTTLTPLGAWEGHQAGTRMIEEGHPVLGTGLQFLAALDAMAGVTGAGMAGRAGFQALRGMGDAGHMVDFLTDLPKASEASRVLTDEEDVFAFYRAAVQSLQAEGVPLEGGADLARMREMMETQGYTGFQRGQSVTDLRTAEPEPRYGGLREGDPEDLRRGGRPQPGGQRASDPGAEDIARQARVDADRGVQERADALEPYTDVDPVTALQREQITEDLAPSGGVGERGGVQTPPPPPGQVDTGMRGVWTSPVRTFLESHPKIPDKTTGVRWKKLLENAPHSRTEREWSGIDEWLESRRGESITRSEVEEFFEANRPRLTESVRGAQAAQGAVNLDSPYATPAVRRLVLAHQGDADDALLLSLANDGDSYRELMRRFPELEENEDWAEFVLGEVTGGRQDIPAPKFQEYTLPGGEDYKEILVQLEPNVQPFAGEVRQLTDPSDPNQGKWLVQDGGGYILKNTEEEAQAFAQQRARARAIADAGYRTSHWDEPNVLVHVRATTHQGADGGRYTMVNEVQSDWHQAGRDRGYVREDRTAEIATAEAEYKALRDRYVSGEFPEGSAAERETQRALDRLSGRVRDLRMRPNGVPDAPYKNTPEWVGLGVRRAIQDAIESGTDGVAMIRGEQARDLYPDLSELVSEVRYDPETRTMFADPLDGGRTVEKQVEPEDLAAEIGKEPAKQLLASTPTPMSTGLSMGPPRPGMLYIAGDDLRLGGHGMIAFYDEIVPSVMRAEAKRLGLTVDEVPFGERGTLQFPDGATEPVTDLETARHYTASNGGTVTELPSETHPTIRITPADRERLQREGLRLGAALPEAVAGAAAAGAAAFGVPLLLQRLREREDEAEQEPPRQPPDLSFLRR
jgi:hypothetical protein